MPKASTKHPERMNRIVFSDFSGGEVYGIAPESLETNELQVLTNWEYDTITGHPRCTYPFEEYCDVGETITDVFVNNPDDYFLVTCGQNLYKIPVFTGVAGAITGTLNGAKDPSFALWSQDPREILIASGGKLQGYDGTTLSDVTNAPNADIVFVRGPSGRIGTARSGHDAIVYSGVGDKTNWTDDPADDSSSKELEVGYKDSGDIVAVVPMPSDLVVFKDNGKVYRVIGEYPDWVIKENQPMSPTISKHTVARVANDVMYLTPQGFRALSVTEKYGDMLQRTVSEKVDQYLADNSNAAAKVWYVPSNGQVYINPNGSTTAWILHLATSGAWSHITFDSNITKVFEYNGNTYLVSGTKIYKQITPTGGSVTQQASMKMRKMVFDRDVILKEIILNIQPITSSTGRVLMANISLPFETGNIGDIAALDNDIAFSDNDPLYIKGEKVIRKKCNVRTDILEPELIVTDGCVAVRKLALYYAEG